MKIEDSIRFSLEQKKYIPSWWHREHRSCMFQEHYLHYMNEFRLKWKFTVLSESSFCCSVNIKWSCGNRFDLFMHAFFAGDLNDFFLCFMRIDFMLHGWVCYITLMLKHERGWNLKGTNVRNLGCGSKIWNFIGIKSFWNH